MRDEGRVGSLWRGLARPAALVPRHAFRRFARLVRQIFGMPDYDRYLEHRRACHPGEPVLSRAEYFAQQIERRYSGGPNRCC